jgi:threonine synthase
MGLPVQKFIAATNTNDTVPAYLKTGVYQPKPSVSTLSNAMDVGNPSNWARIADLFKEDASELNGLITGYSYNDEQTKEAIQQVFDEYNYVVCPHTAIAWKALKEWESEANPGDVTGVFLSTAHPCKFPDAFPAEIAAAIKVPESVKELEGKEKQAVALGKDFEGFKEFLLNNN